MTDPHATAGTEGIRLSKRVADILKCSRAEAEQVIVGGWVKVNNLVVDEPAHRVKDEQIDIHSTAQRGKVPLLTVILHKTPGQSCLSQSHNNIWKSLTPETRTHQDRSGITLTPRLQKSLQCAAALEDAATGLVVLTEDPAMLRKLLDERTPLEHEMLAEVQGPVSPDQLHDMCPTGLKTSISSATPEKTGLRMAFKGYQPGYAAGVIENTGLRLTGLKRVRVGRVLMAPLAPGEWRALMPYERF
ncbi:MAG: RNA-binding protein [Betaproteobacteria bacterium]|nr:RNA-binding protein [Betaproteobacteria bacterium]